MTAIIAPADRAMCRSRDIARRPPAGIEGRYTSLAWSSMTLLVIGAMVGGGVFNLPQNMAQKAGLGAVLVAWLVSGLGIFFLARTFQVLADIKPDLTAGIYMYSRQGFGKYAGFQIAWGYWLSSAFGNVGFAILLMDTLNYFFPPHFKGGNTWLAVLLGVVGVLAHELAGAARRQERGDAQRDRHHRQVRPDRRSSSASWRSR